MERTRADHAQEIAQDYAEYIQRLIRERGAARAVDIARRFGVSHVTVGKTLRRMQRLGLVTLKPYQPIALTESGRVLAQESQHRHNTVLQFLLAIGVPSQIAESDTEGIEHHVSHETLAAFARIIKKLR